jgi:hypothetical protein
MKLVTVRWSRDDSILATFGPYTDETAEQIAEDQEERIEQNQRADEYVRVEEVG